MNLFNLANIETKGIAALLALAATFFTAGGTLTLAEHYARAGTNGAAFIAANSAAQTAARS